VAEQLNELTDAAVRLHWVAEGPVGIDGIRVSATDLPGVEIALGEQLVDDALCGPFSDADAVSDIANADPRIINNREEDMGVVGKECPCGDWRGRLLHA
jgi:hypothetical protein